MNHGKLILKNYMINTLIELLSVPLAGQTARSRNRFILGLTDITHELEAERQTLLKKYGDLTPEGELQIDEKTGNYKLKDAEAFDAAFKELTERTFEMPCIAEKVVDFQAMHRTLETLETPMSVATTTVYEKIMQAFDTWAESQKTQ